MRGISDVNFYYFFTFVNSSILVIKIKYQNLDLMSLIIYKSRQDFVIISEF